jgi:serine/threonine protein kinase
MKICVKKLLLRKRRGRSSALDDVLAEIVLLSRLRHPNIVLLHEVINDPQQDYIYMGMIYCCRLFIES